MRRLLLLLPALLLLAALPGPAEAKKKPRPLVGIADQGSAMFAHPLYGKLRVGRISRLVVSYDTVLRRTDEMVNVDSWLGAVDAADVQPLISFNHSRGCYDGKGVVRRKVCRLPSVKRFGRAFRAFRKRYPQVRVYSPWNEVNHRSQPTARRPRRAAQFYNLVRRRCKTCTVVAADVLDQPGVGRYLRRFKRHARGKPRLWGLHNYQDANDYTTDGTREVLRAVKGKLWLTETGGIVKLGTHRPYNPRRAAKAVRFMFRLGRRFKRIKRIYIYNWTGGDRTYRFDSGLTNIRGRGRPAYRVVRRYLISRPSGPLRPEPPFPPGAFPTPAPGPEPGPPPESTGSSPPPQEPPPEEPPPPGCGLPICLPTVGTLLD